MYRCAARAVAAVCLAGAVTAAASTARALNEPGDTVTPTVTPTFTPPPPSPSATPTVTPPDTFIVGSIGDGGDALPGDGVCDDGSGACTLRAAAEETLALTLPPCGTWFEHTITLAVAGVIALQEPVYLAAGACGRTVHVEGPGAAELTVLGGGLVLGGSGAAGSYASVRGLTVRTAGIGIHHQATNLGYPSEVQLADVVLTDNDIGIGFNFRAMLAVEQAVIEANRGDGIGRAHPDGGQASIITVDASQIRRNGAAGIDAYAQRVTISDTTITGNGEAGVRGPIGGVVEPEIAITGSTIADNDGSGIALGGSGLRITASTISGNGAGGVLVARGPAALVNSTVSGNRSAGDGGGVRFDGGGTLALHNVTIAGNVADDDGDGAGDGGGVFVGTGHATLANSIVADNNDAGDEAPDCGGAIAVSRYSLLQRTTGCTLAPGGVGNLLGVGAELGALGANGGPTFTHLPEATSPIRDAGDPAGCADAGGVVLASDQRGVARPQGATCDLGALELEPVPCDPVTCDDGDPCTTDTCAAAGCVQVAAPAPDCLVAASSGLVMRHGEDESRDVFVWKWGHGAALDWPIASGDPTGGAPTAVCVYAGEAGTPIARALLPTSGWTAIGRGVRFRGDGPDGITVALLKDGQRGRSRFLVRGSGSALPDPSLPTALPLIVQLRRNGSPLCLESRFTVTRGNGAARLTARVRR